MRWFAPKIWNGEDCWIIGGGRSIYDVFNVPPEIKEGITSSKLPISSLSPYLKLLHDKHVIAINSAFLLGDWIDVCFFGDRRWYLRYYKKELSKFKGIIVGCSPVLNLHQFNLINAKYLSRDGKGYGITTNPRTVCWNKNSGAAAISLAAHFGVKRIYLLGFDMKLQDKLQNFHSHYLKVPYKEAEFKAERETFHRHLVGFQHISYDAKRLNIKIINVNMNSAISDFPKKELKDIL